MREYFNEIRGVFERLAEAPPESLETFVEAVHSSWDQGGKVISFGNGGSAADSLHFTAELVARFRTDPIHQPAVSLCANPSTLTAVANDWSFEQVFARQVRALANPPDVLLGISTSGSSPNVVQALRTGEGQGLRCFGLTGASPGRFDGLSATLIQVPASVTAHVQEAHIACLHYACLALDRRIND